MLKGDWSRTVYKCVHCLLHLGFSTSTYGRALDLISLPGSEEQDPAYSGGVECHPKS
jgi:hypothetical protein